MKTTSVVFVVDDNLTARRSLRYLVESHGLTVSDFSSPQDFLDAYDPAQHGCLIVDFQMPEMTGLDLQDELITRGFHIPVIVITGHGDVATCARAFRSGAFDFLEKPAQPELLIERIQQALSQDLQQRKSDRRSKVVAERMALLTPRETDVMNHLVQGNSIKEIASEFQTSFQTVAKHRARILAKLEVENDVELVRCVLETKTPRHPR